MTTQHHTCARCGVADEFVVAVTNREGKHEVAHSHYVWYRCDTQCIAALKRENAALRVRERDLEKCIEEALATCSEKQQQIDRLRAAIIEARRQLEMGRTWGGMSWKWHHRAAEMGYKALGTALESDSGKAAMGE